MSVLALSPKAELTEQDIGRARQFKHLFQQEGETSLTLQMNGVNVPLPDSLTTILSECLEIMAEGHGVAVMPMDEEIGTQEASDMLGVSRPYLVKLLDSHAIPSRKVGVQRRVRIDDVKAYKDREKAARRKVLTELAAEGQRLKLGE